jgi:iron complex outermembrane receptor protein
MAISMTNNSRRRLACSIVPLSLLPLAAGAQQGQPATPTPPDEIIVTATLLDRTLDRVPVSVSVISQDDIQRARQQVALDEALAQVPGLFMQNRYNFAQDLRISIRGFGARAQFGIRGIKVVVDGIPETLPDGQGSVDSLDIGATSQIEIIRGPSSSMYGNAAGGVIALTSEGGGPDPYAEVRVAGGTYDYQKLQFKTGGATDRVDYLVSVSELELDGYRAQSRAVNRQTSGRFNIDLDNDRSLLAVLNYTDQPQSDDAGALTRAAVALDPRAAFPGNVTFQAGEVIEQTRLGFVYTTPAGEHGTISARNYYAWRDFGNLLPMQLSGIVNFDRAFAGGGVSYSYDGFWLDRPNRLVTGIDFEDQDDDRTRFDNLNGVPGTLRFDQREHVTTQAVYLQNELSLSKKAQLTMGVRFDNVEFEVTDRYFVDGLNDSGALEFEHTSPMIGATYEVAPRLTLYGSLSSSFETPTTTELNRPDLAGGFNPDVDPQIADSLEIGIRGSLSERQRYEIVVFNIDVKDELIPLQVPGQPGRNYYVNAAKTAHDGIELSWSSQPTDRLATTLSYTYSDFTFTEGLSAGNVIPGTSENVLFGQLIYTHPRGWFIAGDAIFIDEQFGDNANTAAGLVDSYTLANLRAGYDVDLGKMTLSPYVGINNVFDEDYISNVRVNPFVAPGAPATTGRFFEPGPTRNLYAGVTMNWKFR